MIILPAIDLKGGEAVRLFKGDFGTAEIVAADAVETAIGFEKQGANWLHIVDLDGAKNGKPVNSDIISRIRQNTGMNIEVGGGIRDMETVDFYISNGINRVILGSAALKDKSFIKEAINKYGKKIAVGIDAKNGKVAVNGWLETSDVSYLDLAAEMGKFGCSYLIVTDISTDGTLSGPNFSLLAEVNKKVKCSVIASGGVSCLDDVIKLREMGVYGVIAGKAIYSERLNLEEAVIASQKLTTPISKNEFDDNLERYFKKCDLIPAIIQEHSSGDVLMMAYMNIESLKKTLETGYTWFYSRSRNCLWNKGETSGNVQEVVGIYADCDDDTLLIKVKQTGAACHTGRFSCFYKEII